MPSRFAIAVIFAGTLAIHISYAQQECGKPPSSSPQAPCAVKTEDYDVVVGSTKDGYEVLACGVDGRVYLKRRLATDDPSHTAFSVVGVSPDGSIVNFELPEMVMPSPVAVEGFDLNILTTHFVGAQGHFREMYHFDKRGNLLAKRWMPDDFRASIMAFLPSGKTIALDTHGTAEDVKHGGTVLDADGHVINSFDLPLPPGGGGWIFASYRMGAGDGVAYAILQSETTPSGPLTAIAAISETGHLDIKVIPAPPDTAQRHHNQWVFGPRVAVEVYHMVGERITFHFDEYDLNTGEKVASKIAHISGGAFGCYTGAEVSMLAPSAHVDPARGLSPDTLRLVISKLQ
ncbi:MAG TPA: hypothetical protein VIH89_13890 [Candidatus Sulfotelmatobacter sp.]|jgi:hypothetical protein